MLRLPVTLFCVCAASLARAAILPIDLEPKVGAHYEPADAEERAIWKDLARLEEGIRSSPQRLEAPALDAWIRGVVERLTGRAAPDLRIYVMRDTAPNAAMLPNGMMIVNTGLLARVRDEAQLAAVLAHEAGHYFRKHALDLYRADRRKYAWVSPTISAIHSYDDSRGASTLVNPAALMLISSFSRNLESEADAYGLMLMARAGYGPRAALAVWEQLLDERRASAAERQKGYRDVTNAELSTHPPSKIRMTNLADTAGYLAAKPGVERGSNSGEWAEVIRPYQPTLLRDQIFLNDPGASRYLLEARAQDGWTALLRFYEGEVYRLRSEKGDEQKAAAAYAAATMLPEPPPDAWRAHGYALLKAGRAAEAREALNRFLALDPAASDAAMVLSALANPAAVDEAAAPGGHLSNDNASNWKRLRGNVTETRWEKVWSRSGPQIDRMAVIDGLPDGKAMLLQNQSDDNQVPVFHADMTALDLVSMLEVSYRVRGVTVFNIESVEPVLFLGGRGVKLEYSYASGIVIPKKGRCVLRIAGRKLYAMKLDSVANTAFHAVAAEFDQLVYNAQLRH